MSSGFSLALHMGTCLCTVYSEVQVRGLLVCSKSSDCVFAILGLSGLFVWLFVDVGELRWTLFALVK